jgi:hypothetical protein
MYVARMLIEDIRATVTEESRRKALIEEAVDAFENAICLKQARRGSLTTSMLK